MKAKFGRFIALFLAAIILTQIPFSATAQTILSGVVGGDTYYKVTFTAGNHVIANQFVKNGEGVVFPQAPEQQGAYFKGWFDGEREYTEGTPITEDVNLLAKFVDIQKRTVRIRYLNESGEPVAGAVVREYTGDESGEDAIKSPHVQGMLPDKETVFIEPRTLTEDTELIVTYTSAKTTYAVHHHFQAVEGDNYVHDSKYDEHKDGNVGEIASATPLEPMPEGFSFSRGTNAQIEKEVETIVEAYYTRNIYSIAFDAQGGTPVAPISAKHGTAIALPGATRAGYSFEGWYLDAEYRTFAGGEGDPYIIPATKGAVLYAKWAGTGVSYTVVYWLEKPNVTGTPNPKNASDLSKYAYHSKATVNAPAGVQIPEKGVPKITIKDSKNRVDIADCVYSTPATVNGDGSTVINAYYNRKVFTFNFKCDEGSFTMLGSNYKAGDIYSFTGKYQQDISGVWPSEPPAKFTISLKGFTGWKPNLPGTIVWAMKVVTVPAEMLPESGTSVTFTADYTSVSDTTYTVNFFLEQLPGQSGESVKRDNVTYIKDMANTEEFKAYAFASWHHKEIDGMSFVEEYRPNWFLHPNTYNFCYKRNRYTLSFNTQGIGNAPTSQTLMFEQSLSDKKPSGYVEASTVQTINGVVYTFGGWYSDPRCLNAFDFAAEKMPARNLELFAKWIRPSNQVHVNLNYLGAPSVEPISVPDGDSAAKDLPGGTALLREGFVFTGWYSDPTCLNAYNVTDPVRKPMTLYAGWEAIEETQYTFVSYTVLYLDEAGNAIADPKTVLRLESGEEVTEKPIVIEGFRPNEASITILLGALSDENIIEFHYQPIGPVNYTVEYGYFDAESQWHELCEPEVGITDKTRIVIVAKTFPDYYSLEKTATLEPVTDAEKNTVRFEYVPYGSAPFEVLHCYFDGADYAPDPEKTLRGTARIGETIQDVEKPTATHVFEKATPSKYRTVISADANNPEPIVLTYFYQYGTVSYDVEYYYAAMNGDYSEDPDEIVNREATYGDVAEVSDDDKIPKKSGYMLDHSRSEDWSCLLSEDNPRVLKVYYTPDLSAMETINFTICHIGVDEGGTPIGEPLFEKADAITYWIGADVPTLDAGMLESDKTYPGYVFSEYDEKYVGSAIQNGDVYDVYYRANYGETEQVAFTVRHIGVDEGGTPIGEPLFEKDDEVTYWIGADVPTLDVGMLESDKTYPGYVFLKYDEKYAGSTVQNGGVYEVYYRADYNDREPLSYTVRHMGTGITGEPGSRVLYEFNESTDFWRGETAPLLTEKLLETDAAYPGFAFSQIGPTLFEPIENDAVYEVFYKADYEATASIAFTVIHMGTDIGVESGDRILAKFDEEQSYWLGGEEPSLTEALLHSGDTYRGFVFSANDARLHEPVSDGAEYTVTYKANFEDRFAVKYSIRHIVVGADGKQIGNPLASFEEETSVWFGDPAPALTDALLRSEAHYPGYERVAVDDRRGSPVENDAKYLVKYGVDEKDVEKLTYTVQHIVVDEAGKPTGKTFLSASQSTEYWRGGAAPVLKADMLNKVDYPGYTFLSNDEQVGKAIQNGATYSVNYKANYGDAASLKYTLQHIVVDKAGNETGAKLMVYNGQTTYWRGGDAPVLTIDLLAKPNGYPGYQHYADDARIAKAMKDGETYTVKYMVNEADTKTIGYRVTHVGLGGKDVAERTFISNAKQATYWRGESAPLLTEEMLQKPSEYPGYKLKSTDARVGAPLEDGAEYIVEYAINEKDTATVSYTVEHVLQGGAGKPIADSLKTFSDSAKYWRGGEAPLLTEEMLHLAEYPGNAYIANDARVGKAVEEGAVYTVEYARLPDVSIRYVARMGGKVSVGLDPLNPETGTPQGATAIANHGYTFKNWTDAKGRIVGNKEAFTPERAKNANWVDGTTYYANFTIDAAEAEFTTIRGSITWAGVPQGVVYPDVVVELYRNGGGDPYLTTTITGGATGYSFPDVPIHGEDGEQCRYTVSEMTPDDYTVSYDGYDITNTYKPGTTSVAVRVVWDVPDNAVSLPATTITLLQDGHAYAGGAGTLVLKGGNWSGRFNGLPKKAEDGHNYLYTVTQGAVPGFALSGIGGTMETGYTITNTARLLNVFFIDRDGGTLKQEQVLRGSSATPPEVPDHPGYQFVEWVGSYENVTGDAFVVARYQKEGGINAALIGEGFEIIDATIPLAAGTVATTGDSVD